MGLYSGSSWMVGNKHTTHHQGGNLKGILPEMCDDINLFSICTVVSSALARGKVQFLMIIVKQGPVLKFINYNYNCKHSNQFEEDMICLNLIP